MRQVSASEIVIREKQKQTPKPIGKVKPGKLITCLSGLMVVHREICHWVAKVVMLVVI